jgi:CheY-like chemotaxis protein
MNYYNILIIDDDADDIGFLCEALQNFGITEIMSVHSAAAAFSYLNNCPPGKLPKLIVTDINLPVVSGVGFINELKKVDRFSSIPFIVLTTHNFEYVKDVYENLPVSDIIKKPNNFKDYVQIADYLTKKIAS